MSGTGNIFLGDSQASVYEYTSAGVLEGAKESLGNSTNGGIWDGAIVDSTNQKVYFTMNCSPTTPPRSALAQIPFTGTGLGTAIMDSISTNGSGCSATLPIGPLHSATPDNQYYTLGISSSDIANNGHILVSYQGTASIRLAQWQFVSGALQTGQRWNTNSIYMGASVASSPSTEFYGSSVAYTPSALMQIGTTVTVTTSASNLVTTCPVTNRDDPFASR